MRISKMGALPAPFVMYCSTMTEQGTGPRFDSIDTQIKNNEQESRRLVELRDTLLPRLMSGELEVYVLAYPAKNVATENLV